MFKRPSTPEPRRRRHHHWALPARKLAFSRRAICSRNVYSRFSALTPFALVVVVVPDARPIGPDYDSARASSSRSSTEQRRAYRPTGTSSTSSIVTSSSRGIVATTRQGMARGACRAVGQRLGRLLKTFYKRQRRFRGVSYWASDAVVEEAPVSERANSKATDRVEDVLNLAREDVEE